MGTLLKKLSYFGRRELSHTAEEEIGRTGLNDHGGGDGSSPSFGELFKRVGYSTMDFDRDDVGNLQSYETENHVLELDSFPAVGGDCNRHRCLPFFLEFRELTYGVKTGKSFSACREYNRTEVNVAVDEESGMKRGSRMKTLLSSISGEAREGEILAVLGASGSGKSTLIDALANRISSNSLGGSVTLNGEPLTGRLLKVISAYVMQDDLLFPTLTVEETLMFSAEFRLPRSLSAARKRQRVDALIEQLGLRNATNTLIGDEGHRGVSGGERRRVSIGIDIIHDPIILFLDEPTSGLDSTSAFMVAKVLQKIAQTGSIVFMTIHQPSSRILGLLDRLIFLSRGNTVFNGTPNDLQPYFSEFGRPIPENENRTEFALDLIRELEEDPSEIRRLVEHNNNWQKTKAADTAGTARNASVSLEDAIGASISRGKLVSGATDGAAGAAFRGTAMKQKYANPFWVELGVLSRRSFLNTKRQPKQFGIRLGTVLATGFILATIFWQVDNSPKGVQERLGFFAFAMSTMFYSCVDALPVFLHERYIFMRETAYNAYRRSSYVLANSVVAIPPLIILAVAFAAITFFAVGLVGGFHGFGFYFLIILASFWSGSSFVTFISGLIPQVMVGYTVVVAILAYFLLLSGFFITRNRIPCYWLWFHYLSLIKYPYEAVLRNEFGDQTKCFVRGVQIFDTSPLASLPYPAKVRLLRGMSSTIGASITPNTCFTTGVDVLQRQGITHLTKWNALFITFAWGLLFRILFYFSLLLGSKNKRR